MRKLSAVLLAAVVLPVAGAPPEPPVPVIPTETRAELDRLLGAALTSSNAAATVRSLTDSVGPRPAGSAGDAAAVSWALAAMRGVGFENVHTEAVTVTPWKRGDESGAVVAPFAQPLVLTALGGSVPTPAGGLEADVMEADSLEAIDALGEKAKGRIVFVNRRMECLRDGSGYGKAVLARTRGASRAARLGAVGILIRSISTSDTRLPHTGSANYAKDAPQIPAAALANPDADLLHRLLEGKAPVRVRLSLSCRTLPPVASANVVGEVRGRKRPDEIVVLGAHLDSWDLGTGAVDDGAGCGIAIEAAHLAAGRRPLRTLRVVLFANEEHGLDGAKAYAAAHAAELQKHVAAIEVDGGAGRAYGLSWLAGEGAAMLTTEVASFLRGIGAGEVTKGAGGADISQLRAAGVPLFGVKQDLSRYFDIHHSADDTFDKIDPAELDSVVAAVTVLAYALADVPEPVSRIPESERVATRER